MTHPDTRLGWLAAVLLCATAATTPAAPPQPINADFEQSASHGAPIGWTVLTGLDPQAYGPPKFEHDFAAVRPTTGLDGYRSAQCLSFPATEGWFCPVFTHHEGSKGQNGKVMGKAAAYQTVELPPGDYRFCGWLRTAGGHLYAAGFGLGVSFTDNPQYAHDNSTGIRWTAHDLGMRRSELRGVRERGEWARYTTEPFSLKQAGKVTLWIRFNYLNENQFLTRWQVDDVSIEAVSTREVDSAEIQHHPPCPTPRVMRERLFAGDLETQLVDAGDSELVSAKEVRLFRRARQIPPGTRVTYRFQPNAEDLPLVLLMAASGNVEAGIAGQEFRVDGADPLRPTTREFAIPPGSIQRKESVAVVIRNVGDHAARLYELEVGTPARTAIRLLHVEHDAIAVPWIIGSWDASAREFTGDTASTHDAASLSTGPLAANGRWEIAFEHRPVPGHRYWLIHGALGGRASMDIGGDGLIDWLSENKGEEIVNFDATDLLTPGANRVVLDTTGEHDFAALLEVCPGSTDPSTLRVSFDGNDDARNLTRVVDNTWFWLRELHYEPSGFIDASVPRGKWYGQYWPVDIGFALREWVRWGYHDESRRCAELVSGRGWHGDESNRSGGADNTGGNIMARELVEILRRSDAGPQPDSDLWKRVRQHCEEVIANAEKSPFGLIRGTNWENAGNLKNGTCYALSTTLGGAAGLRKAAMLAEAWGMDDLAAEWRAAAKRIRDNVLDKLVLKADHRCPSGFILPAGTFAYGLRVDGTIEDEPLAGYFWAGGAPADVEGFIAEDKELMAVYDRTLTAALPLFSSGTTHIVSGYAESYDGPEACMLIAALCDRVDALGALIKPLMQVTDFERDTGQEFAELSRWAYGTPNWAEDTNLVGAAYFLWGLRAIIGIDDLLADGRQLRLVPRLPWSWTQMAVNDWAVRARDAEGAPRWTRLTFELQRDRTHASMKLRTTEEVTGLQVRLGPFAKETAGVKATVGGRAVPARLEVSGDAGWAWVTVDSAGGEILIRTTADNSIRN